MLKGIVLAILSVQPAYGFDGVASSGVWPSETAQRHPLTLII
jgi:hypothetical protein